MTFKPYCCHVMYFQFSFEPNNSLKSLDWLSLLSIHYPSLILITIMMPCEAMQLNSRLKFEEDWTLRPMCHPIPAWLPLLSFQVSRRPSCNGQFEVIIAVFPLLSCLCIRVHSAIRHAGTIGKRGETRIGPENRCMRVWCALLLECGVKGAEWRAWIHQGLWSWHCSSSPN